MKKLSKDAIGLIIICVVAVTVMAISVAFAKWVANSDMPLWLKYWLLMLK